MDLIVLPSFPLNKAKLKGFTDFLGDYFTLHVIDYPGFSKQTEPLEKITKENLLYYLKKQIDALNLNSYILCGISMGFYLASHLNDRKCKGILALEPATGSRLLRANRFTRSFNSFILSLGGENLAWTHPLFRKSAERSLDCPKGRIDWTLKDIDPRSFFATLDILISTDQVKPRDLPTLLVINDKDRVIKAPETISFLKENLTRLTILKTTLDHYPHPLTKANLKKHIDKEKLQSAVDTFLRDIKESR
jgi:pimeloyl-ACP methyl ester carboxylesterase